MICQVRRAASLSPKPRWRRVARSALAAMLLIASGCGGSLSSRSVADLSGELPLDASVQRIRLEVPNGTVGVKPGAGRTVKYGGGVRRAADSPADLAKLEAIPLDLLGILDAAEPGTLVIRAPGVGTDDPMGVFGLELGLFVPPGIPLQIVIAGSGHVTLAGRGAATQVNTGRGDLRFEGCTGPLVGHTGRGNVIAFDHVGDIDLDAGTGDMQVFVPSPGRLIRLVTGQGTVQCHIPEATGFEVDAAAAIGRIGNGFGLAAEKTGDYSAALRGKRGSGDTNIILRTGSGHLALSPKSFDPQGESKPGGNVVLLLLAGALVVAAAIGAVVFMRSKDVVADPPAGT